MTEEQKKLKAERDRRYREKKKAEKDMQSRGEADKVSGSPNMGAEGRCESCSPLDLQAPIDPAPESVMQASDSVLVERYRKEFQAEPVLDEPLTNFDVYKRRMEREGRR